MKKPSDPIALQVRMTEGLRRRLAKAAEEQGRSLNAEIVQRLDKSFEEISIEIVSLPEKMVRLQRQVDRLQQIMDEGKKK
jgi:predicted  nucleic acid-binding Zn-ribbon protein